MLLLLWLLLHGAPNGCSWVLLLLWHERLQRQLLPLAVKTGLTEVELMEYVAWLRPSRWVLLLLLRG